MRRTMTGMLLALACVAACGDAKDAPAPTPAPAAAPARATAPAPVPETVAAPVAPVPAGGLIDGRLTAGDAPVDARVELRRFDDHAASSWADTLRTELAGADVLPPLAVVDGRGSYAFRDVAPGAYRLVARGAGALSATADVEIAAVRQHVVANLRLFAPAWNRVLRGRVVGPDGLAGRGFVQVAGVAWPSPSAPLAEDGTFVLPGLPAGKLTPRVLLPGRHLIETPAIDPAPDAVVEIDLRATLRPLAVRVVTADGEEPVAGAAVRVSRSSEPRFEVAAITGEDGDVQLAVAKGEVEVTVAAEEFPEARIEVREDRAEVLVALQRIAEVTVRVTGGGAPVPGVTVMWTALDSHIGVGTARTDARGVARLGPVRAGRALVFAAGERWVSEGFETGGGASFRGGPDSLGSSMAEAPRKGIFEIPAAGRVQLEIEAEPAREVTGRVLDAQGAPVAGALVSAPPPEWIPWPIVFETAWTHAATGADGSFVLRGVFPRAGQVLRASAPGHVTAEAPLPADGAPVDLRFVASATPLVLVREKSTGAPVADATLEPRPEGKLPAGVHIDSWRTRTGPDGSASVGPLPFAVWSIDVECRGYLPTAPVVLDATRLADAAPVAVELVRGSAVDTDQARMEAMVAAFTSKMSHTLVRVVDERGRLVESGSYWIRNPSDGSSGGFSGGTFDLTSGVAQGGATLELYRLRDGSGVPAGVGAAFVMLPNPLPRAFEIRLARARPIRGSVRDAQGRAVAGARVTARPASGPSGRERGFLDSKESHGFASSDADGAFAIPGLGDMDYLLETQPPEAYVPAGTVKAHGGADGVAIVVISGLRPRVLVLGPGGEPRPGMQVEIGGSESDVVASATTGPDGAVVLPALPAGRTFELEVKPPWESDVLPHDERGWTPKAETTVRLAKSFSVAGTIVDAAGRPMPRATYWAQQPGYGFSRETADQQGRFGFWRVREGEVLVAAGDFPSHQWSVPGTPALDDPESVAKLATRIPAGTMDARVVMDAGASLEVAFGAAGDAKPDPDSTALLSSDGQKSHWPSAGVTRGTLLFTGLDPKRTYTLLARFPDAGLVAYRAGLVPGTRVDVVPVAGKELAGKVVLPTAPPYKYVEVRAELGSVSVRTMTAADGSFRIGALPPVTMEVRVFASDADGGWCDDFHAMPGGDSLTLTPADKPIPATPR